MKNAVLIKSVSLMGRNNKLENNEFTELIKFVDWSKEFVFKLDTCANVNVITYQIFKLIGARNSI